MEMLVYKNDRISHGRFGIASSSSFAFASSFTSSQAGSPLLLPRLESSPFYHYHIIISSFVLLAAFFTNMSTSSNSPQGFQWVPASTIRIGDILFLPDFDEFCARSGLSILCCYRSGNTCPNYCRLVYQGFNHPVAVVHIAGGWNQSDEPLIRIFFVQVIDGPPNLAHT